MDNEKDTNWRDFIQKLFIENLNKDYEVFPCFNPPAVKEDIERIERTLKIIFPTELKSLLLEIDGVDQIMNHSVGQINIGAFIWSTATIDRENLYFRLDKNLNEFNKPFDSLLFFADAGNGDCFAFLIEDNIVKSDIYSWNHENDSRDWVAPSLKEFIQRSCEGKIST